MVTKAAAAMIIKGMVVWHHDEIIDKAGIKLKSFNQLVVQLE